MAPTGSRGKPLAAAALALAVAVAAAGCGGGAAGTTPSRAASTGSTGAAPAGGRIALTSAAFGDGRPIPRQFSCDAVDDSPPLQWTGVPAGTVELALVMEDPGAQGGTFTHWTMYGIAPTVTQMPAGQVPSGALQGTNSFNQTEYGGPCPPAGDPPHRYVFTLYALRAASSLPAGAPVADVRAAIARTAFARGTLTGTYARGG